MLLFTEVVPQDQPGEPTLTLSLTHDQRRRARLRIELPAGEIVALMLDRGIALRHGDRLRSEGGDRFLLVTAADELISVASTADSHLLARAAYHLGNRHVPLQVGTGSVAYPHDHVLDGMCRELGLAVESTRAPFEPESGGYGHHAAGHDHP